MAPKKAGKLTLNFQPQRKTVEELKAIAFADMGDYVQTGPDGRLQLRQEALADPAKMKAVEYLEQTEHGFKIRLRDKLAALKELKPYLESEALGRGLASLGVTGIK